MKFIVLFSEEKNGGYSAFIPDVKGCNTCAETMHMLEDNLREALAVSLDSTSQYCARQIAAEAEFEMYEIMDDCIIRYIDSDCEYLGGNSEDKTFCDGLSYHAMIEILRRRGYLIESSANSCNVLKQNQ